MMFGIAVNPASSTSSEYFSSNVAPYFVFVSCVVVICIRYPHIIFCIMFAAEDLAGVVLAGGTSALVLP